MNGYIVTTTKTTTTKTKTKNPKKTTKNPTKPTKINELMFNDTAAQK